MAEDKKNFDDYSCKERSQCIYNNFGKYIEDRRWYQHDIDQIVYSTSFRKMQRKHQLISERDPRCRSRMIHTLEVARIAKEISEKLNLDSELTEAISLAHDLGNSAYGSVSNSILADKTNNIFKHEEASFLMLKYITQKKVDNIEIKGKLIHQLEKMNKEVTNLTLDMYFPYKFEMYCLNGEYYYTCICDEILDGVIKHGTKETAFTLEGQVVNFSDNIAYLSQDIDDLMAVGIFDQKEINTFTSKIYGDLEISDKVYRTWDQINENAGIDLTHVFSASSSERIGTLIKCFINYNTTNINKLDYIKSPILRKAIPVLKVEQGLQVIIDYLWNYTAKFYNNTLINTSNEIEKCKINILWEIISHNQFVCQNESYINFFKRFENPIFKKYFSEKKYNEDELKIWKKAFFIANLSCDEIDLIIELFQQRDYTFELDL